MDDKDIRRDRHDACVERGTSVNTGSQGGGEDERGRGTSLRDVSAVSTMF